MGRGAHQRVDLRGGGEADEEAVEAGRVEGRDAGAGGQGVVAERPVDEVVAVLDRDAAVADGGLDEVEVEVTEVAAAGLRGRQPGPHVGAQGRRVDSQQAGDLGRAEAGEQLADLRKLAFAEAVDHAGRSDRRQRGPDGGREIAQDLLARQEGGVLGLLRGRLGEVDGGLEEAGHVRPVELAQGLAGAAVLAQPDGRERVEGAGRRGVAGEQRLATWTQRAGARGLRGELERAVLRDRWAGLRAAAGGPAGGLRARLAGLAGGLRAGLAGLADLAGSGPGLRCGGPGADELRVGGGASRIWARGLAGGVRCPGCRALCATGVRRSWRGLGLGREGGGGEQQDEEGQAARGRHETGAKATGGAPGLQKTDAARVDRDLCRSPLVPARGECLTIASP